MRLISVNGETAVHHVDERPWKCTIRLLSGNSSRGRTSFSSECRNLTGVVSLINKQFVNIKIKRESS